MNSNPFCSTLYLALAALSFCLLTGSRASAQTESQRQAATTRTTTRDELHPTAASKASQVIVAVDEDYRLAPSDVIEVIIEDAPELSGNYRINKAGILPMKFLGSVPVANKTTEEVTAIVTEGLRGRYLRDPKVYITVKQYNSRTFFVQGAVRNPGVFVIESRPSLFRLISIAGGLADSHASTAYIIREKKVDPVRLEMKGAGLPLDQDQPTPGSSKPPPASTHTIIPTATSMAIAEARTQMTGIDEESEYELITSNIAGLYRGRFENNIIVQPNDLVYIPPSEVFFVVGEVKSPGQFTLREGSSIRQAISLSQGLLFKAASNRAIIFRQDQATGKLNEIPVDIGAIMSGKKDDVLLSPNDVIMIPNSRMKSFAGSMALSMGALLTQNILFGIMR